MTTFSQLLMKFPLCQRPAQELPTSASPWVFPKELIGTLWSFVQPSRAERPKGNFTSGSYLQGFLSWLGNYFLWTLDIHQSTPIPNLRAHECQKDPEKLQCCKSATTEVNEFIPELTGSSISPMPRLFENSILNNYSVPKQKMN